jgi:hypothetical protein
MKLDPYSDYWVETKKAPDVIVNIDNRNDNFLTENWTGTRWNEWEDIWTGTETSTRQDSVIQSWFSSPGDPTGIRVESASVDRLITDTFRTGVRISRGIEQTITTTTTERVTDHKVIDTSVAPFIRSKDITIMGTSLKPNTIVYVYFDGVNVTNNWIFANNRIKNIFENRYVWEFCWCIENSRSKFIFNKIQNRR